MEGSERRMFLRNSGLAITAAALADLSVSNSALTQAADTREGPKDLTRELAKFIVSTRFDDIPEAVRHEAVGTPCAAAFHVSNLCSTFGPRRSA